MQRLAPLALALALAACSPPAPPAPPDDALGPDPHSFSRPEEARVRHLDLDLTVDFAARRLDGRAVWSLDTPHQGGELRLDTRDLDIREVRVGGPGEATKVDFRLGEERPFLGRPLIIPIDADTERVEIDYASRPEAAALQWLTPEQTAGGEHPFLFSQSQAALARTWVPCQDSPTVRFTFTADLRVPPELLGLMGATNPVERSADGAYLHEMRQPIPSYLLAIAVGDLEFRPLGERAGVYAEPSVVEAAAWEFAETEDMMTAVEKLYGPYAWERYDILVLPPSFPFGGMENPRLTFVNPTTIAGDRSLVALVAHELAHSWSGNLVTNATWNDFWLNEGFTTYLEMRIMEEVYGRPYAEMLIQLSRQDLDEELAELGADHPDTHLRLDLEGRDPDEGMGAIAYDKGMLLLRTIEETVGRERFDPFLAAWFNGRRFESATTDDFLAFLRRELIADDAELEERLQIAAWVDGPGIPSNAASIDAQGFRDVDVQLAALAEGGDPAAFAVDGWTTHHWVHFLRGLPPELTVERMAELDAAFHFTSTGNAEILHAWLLHTIAHEYAPADAALENFLTHMGRRKFLLPLYGELAKSEHGMLRAREIFAKARSGYHPVAITSVEDELADAAKEAASGS